MKKPYVMNILMYYKLLFLIMVTDNMCIISVQRSHMNNHDKMNPKGTLSLPFGQGVIHNKLSNTKALLFVTPRHSVNIEIVQCVIYQQVVILMYTHCRMFIINNEYDLNALGIDNHGIRMNESDIIPRSNMYSNDHDNLIVHADRCEHQVSPTRTLRLKHRFQTKMKFYMIGQKFNLSALYKNFFQKNR